MALFFILGLIGLFGFKIVAVAAIWTFLENME